MNNVFGTNGFNSQTEEYSVNKYPVITKTFQGSESDVRTSGSIFLSKGWNVKLSEGIPWTMTATIQSELDTDGITPITTTGSFETINWSLHYNVVEKNLLEVGNNGLYNGTTAWIANIDTKDKVTLNDIINNPPKSGSAAWSGQIYDGGVNWGNSVWLGGEVFENGAPFSGSAAASVTASQVAFTMAQNGVKSVPVVQPVLRMSMVVPSDYNLSTFNTDLMKVYHKSRVQSETGLPSNWYNIMPQETDPSSLPVAGSGGSGATISALPLIYGWLKQPPVQDQNGVVINVTQDWVYGLYFQNIYGSRLS